MKPSKKEIAATVGVMAYLQEEKVAAAATGGSPAAYAVSPAASLAWGISGRQAIMQMRSLVQMKAFNGWSKR